MLLNERRYGELLWETWCWLIAICACRAVHVGELMDNADFKVVVVDMVQMRTSTAAYTCIGAAPTEPQSSAAAADTRDVGAPHSKSTARPVTQPTHVSALVSAQHVALTTTYLEVRDEYEQTPV